MARVKNLIGKTLISVLRIQPAQCRQYKLHAAVKETTPPYADPLDALRESPSADSIPWGNWNANAPKNSNFAGRKYILSMARLPEAGKQQQYVFGGVYEILSTTAKGKPLNTQATNPMHRFYYDIRAIPLGEEYFRKLLIDGAILDTPKLLAPNESRSRKINLTLQIAQGLKVVDFSTRMLP